MSRYQKAEPLLMPNTEGPARGLRNTVCICSPLTAKPAPATIAVSACGNRLLKIIFVQISFDSPPVIIRYTSTIGILTEPMNKLTTKRMAIVTIRMMNLGTLISIVYNRYPDNLVLRVLDGRWPQSLSVRHLVVQAIFRNRPVASYCSR